MDPDYLDICDALMLEANRVAQGPSSIRATAARGAAKAVRAWIEAELEAAIAAWEKDGDRHHEDDDGDQLALA